MIPTQALFSQLLIGLINGAFYALLSLGLEHPSLYINDVSGWLPVKQIEAAAASTEVHSLRASMPHTRAGSVTSQGDFA